MFYHTYTPVLILFDQGPILILVSLKRHLNSKKELSREQLIVNAWKSSLKQVQNMIQIITQRGKQWISEGLSYKIKNSDDVLYIGRIRYNYRRDFY